MPRCRICNDLRAIDVLAKVWNGSLSLREAAKELNVSYPMLWHHVRFHETAQSGQKPTRTDTLEILEEITNILKQRLDEMKNLPIGPIHERMLTQNIEVLRRTLMDLERLTGRLRAAPLIQLQQVTIHYEALLSFLTTELCESCKLRIMQFLEKQVTT